jgi:hypothetical protein
MDTVMPFLIAAGIGLLAWASWYLARRHGPFAGLILPGVGIGLAVLRYRVPLGHPEEAMGRGMEVVFLWGPLIVLSLAAALVGLAMRYWVLRRG